MQTIFATLTVLLVGPLAWAVDYPGPPPGPAQATCSATDATLQNDAIAMRWTFGDGHLRPDVLSHKQAAHHLALADSECFRLVLGQTPDPRTRTLNASELKLAGPPAVKRLEPTPDAVRLGDRFGGWELSARLLSTAPDFEVFWHATLRDGANYIRQEVTVQTQREPVESVLSLRNPSDQPADIAIDVAQAFELPSGAAQSYSLRSPWKQDAAAAPIRLTAGQRHTFKLKPFEVVVLDATSE
jgi:hypothetical protein